MSSNLTPEDFECLIHKVLDERRTRDDAEHEEQHAWLREFILCERARRKRLEAIATAALQWSVPVILGSIWYYIKEHLRY